MRYALLLLLPSALLPRAFVQGGEAEKPLQGTWEVVSEKKDGKPLPDPRKGAFTFRFGQDEGVFKTDDPGESFPFRYSVNTGAKPREMDLTLDGGVYRAIYRLDGDTLRLCFVDEKNAERPKSFEANRGRDMVLKRVKAPDPAPVSEAEQLFRDMEKKIRGAKAFRVTFELERSTVGSEAAKQKLVEEATKRLTGTLLLTNDSKVRLKVRGHPEGGGELVSDGERIRTTMALKRDWPTSPKLHGLLSTMVSRAGVWVGVVGMPHLLPAQAEDPEKMFRAYDFKALPPEKVQGREARVVSYRLGSGEGPPKPGSDEELTVWIDSKTLLPLKRMFVTKGDGFRTTEVYTRFEIDPEIGARAFELP